MELILATQQQEFPPRLPEQPYFYPVLTEEYARQIARDWNTKDSNSGHAGFVTQFVVHKSYLQQFEEQQVGEKSHRELWIPAEKLPELNLNIHGRIELLAAYYGEGYRGPKHWYKDWYADEIFVSLQALVAVGAAQDLSGEITLNRDAILLDFAYWLQHDFSEYMWHEQKTTCLKRIHDIWLMKYPQIHLLGSESIE